MKFADRILMGFMITGMFCIPLFAQNPLPNPGFENWSGGAPEGWSTTNVPGVAITVEQSSDSYSGSSAARCDVENFQGTPIMGSILAGQTSQVPVTQNYQQIQGYYKADLQGDDLIVIASNLLDSGFQIVAIAVDTISASNSSYSQFVVPYTYVPGNTADAAYVTIQAGLSTSTPDPNSASYVLFDDFELSGVVGIEPVAQGVKAESFRLMQNYPNPFNPETTIRFNIPSQSFVSLEIFNQLGERVEQLVNRELPTGKYKVTWEAAKMPSGIYFYRISTPDFSDIKSMILLK